MAGLPGQVPGRGTVDRPRYLRAGGAQEAHARAGADLERLVGFAGGGDVGRASCRLVPAAVLRRVFAGGVLDPTGAAGPALFATTTIVPALLEGTGWRRWVGPGVIAMRDCLWGALDGINEAGLAASLAFGGRTVSGTGLRDPLVLRYILEVSGRRAGGRTAAARAGHMSYSVTFLDARAEWATVFVAPDSAVEVTRRKVVTNFQHQIEWPEHARATREQERLACLQQHIDAKGPLQSAVDALLQPPLFQSAWLRGYGTLYSAVYRPRSGVVELLWPGQRWAQSVDGFAAGRREIVYAPGGYALAGQEDQAVMQMLAESRS